MIKHVPLIVILPVLTVILLANCSPGVELPPHKNAYNLGLITGDIGVVHVSRLNKIDMSMYPHLSLRQGYTVKRAVEKFIGGDTIGYVTAIHTTTDVGFVVESMDSAQGGFLFAPIKSAEEALEYANFMFHEPPFSAYSREHVDIDSQQDLDEALSEWKDYKVLKNPPTDITRVTRQNDGKYNVELVFRCHLGKQRIEYMSCMVDSDGNLEALEYYIYVEGPWGAAL